MSNFSDPNSSPSQIDVVAYDPGWAAICSSEVEAIRFAVAPTRAFIDHVGSTAVPGLGGKPVIDLLVTLVHWNDADTVAAALEEIGYRQTSAQERPTYRFFSKRVRGARATAIHLHVAPTESSWGRDMIVFRDALIGDPELAKRYFALKKQLAANFARDPDAYTDGKSDFVAQVLRGAAGAFGNDRLLTHQRAELNRAQRYQYLALASQLAVAVVAAVSVYSNDNGVLLHLAVMGFILAVVWFGLARKQRAHRSAGDQARRMVLLSSGLGEQFSAEQRLRLFDKFTVPTFALPIVREEAYFASRAAPGNRRLAEMIEESAYWTRELQHVSARILQFALGGVGLLMTLGLWLGLPMLPTDSSISLARVLASFLVFMLSSDVVGAIVAHREAASSIGEILQRTETAAARGFPTPDVMLLMSDYNATVESAPFALPGLFKLHRSSLTQRWRAYLENKQI